MAQEERCRLCGSAVGTPHTPERSADMRVGQPVVMTSPDPQAGSLQAGAREYVRTGQGDALMSVSRRLAGQMIGTAEFDGIRRTYENILHRHQPNQGYPQDCAGCRGRFVDWPCDTFELAAADLELLELLDGSRFAPGWPGPVRERRWG